MMRKDEIQTFNLNYQSVIDKFQLKPNFSNHQYAIFYTDNYSFIIFLDKTTKNINCYVHELECFIRPYRLLLLFSTTLAKDNFIKIVDSINKKKINEFSFQTAFDHKETINLLRGLYQTDNINFPTPVNKKLFCNKTQTHFKLILFDYKPTLEKNKISNILCFTDTQYWYQFKIFSGFQIFNKENCKKGELHFFPNPILLTQQFKNESVNILASKSIFDLNKIRLLDIDNNTFFIHINTAKTDDFIFTINFLIAYYNYFINKYQISFETSGSLNYTVHFFNPKSKTPDNLVSSFQTHLQKKAIAKYFGLVSADELSYYVYDDFNFDFFLHKNKSSNTFSITFNQKKELLEIFALEFLSFFLKEKIHLVRYKMDYKTNTFNKI